MLYVEPLSIATCLPRRNVLRRRQGTPLADFFNSLLAEQRLFADSPPDRIQERLCLGRFDEIVHHTLLEE